MIKLHDAQALITLMKDHGLLKDDLRVNHPALLFAVLLGLRARRRLVWIRGLRCALEAAAYGRLFFPMSVSFVRYTLLGPGQDRRVPQPRRYQHPGDR